MKCRTQCRAVGCGCRIGAFLTLFALFAWNTARLPLRASEAQAGPDGSRQIHIGQTIDEVIDVLGMPDLVVDLESRVIYVYKGRKIIFANGRIVDTGSDKGADDLGELTRPANSLESLRDAFFRDKSLNSGSWSTDTALLRALAGSISSPGSDWVTPRIDFIASGMRISGVTGTNQFTGVQSNRCFNAPFTVKATVTGQIAHGNAFELFLVTGDLHQVINLDGNLDPSSGYRGLWENVWQDGSSRPADKVFNAPSTNIWYDIAVAIDADGNASLTVTNEAGVQLVSTRTPNLGTGPFWIILAQREGLPYAVGPNAAIWHEVSVTPGTNTTAEFRPGPVSQGSRVSGNEQQKAGPGDR